MTELRTEPYVTEREAPSNSSCSWPFTRKNL